MLRCRGFYQRLAKEICSLAPEPSFQRCLPKGNGNKREECALQTWERPRNSTWKEKSPWGHGCCVSQHNPGAGSESTEALRGGEWMGQPLK